MIKYNRSLFFNTLIIFILINILIKAFLSINYFDNPMNSYHYFEMEDLSNQPSFTQNNSKSLIYQSGRGQLIDRIISKDRIMTITNDTKIGNLTIRDNAILNVENCNLDIYGKFNVIGNGQIFISNSNITISPGSVGLHEIIVNFSNNASIIIENSRIFTFPQPTVTNISYLVSDDTSKVKIINSYLNFKIPAVLHMDVALSPATAGIFILTGETNWEIQNSKIEGYLMIQNNTLLSRWFLFTLQRSAELIMINCTGFMNDASQPFIKPVAGFLKLIDSIIVTGIIDLEVVANFEAINLTISDIGIMDQSKSQIIQSTIMNNLDIGGFATTPGSAGGKKIEQKDASVSKATLYMEHSEIGNMLLARGSSTSNLVKSSIIRSSILSNAKVNFEQCEIEIMMDVKDNATININNTLLLNIKIGDNCKLNVNQNPQIPKINKIISEFNCHSELTFHSTNIRNIEVFGGDQVPPEEYGPWYDPDLNISKITINMYNSNLDQLTTEDDSQLFIILDESNINEFIITKYKNEPIIVTILDLGSSNYHIPDPWPDSDLKILIYHKIIIETLVNDEPVNSQIIVSNIAGEKIITTEMIKGGQIELELPNKQFYSNELISAGEYSINISYLGFSKIIKTVSEINEKHVIEWEDYNPPVVDNIDIDIDYQRTHRGTRIRAFIKDDGVKVIANATIFYQYYTDDEGWSLWQSSNMIEVENNTFEDEIKQLPQGAEVRFYIVAFDVLGNRGISEKFDYSIPRTDEFLASMAGTLLTVIIVLIIVYFINRRSKVKKYIKKTIRNEPEIDKKDN